MQRTIVPESRFHSEPIAPGVSLERFYPGGREGPNHECLMPTPGGQTWSDMLVLGCEEDDFQMMIPDIRMPANQYWPMHWHDCWTVVFLLEGECRIGDWWMKPGDVFITIPSLEYGPLVVGPEGCRLFEIFAQAHLSPGGYAPEYHDHPTLEGSPKVFLERSPLNQRNEGRQTLSCDGVPGIWKSRFEPGTRWDLGEADDPDRGVMEDVRLDAGEEIAPHSYGDWHAILVMDGTLEIAGHTLGKDHFLRIEPDSTVERMRAGPGGARLLHLARTARGADRRPALSEVAEGHPA